MDDLFSEIGQLVESGGSRIVAVHNAVVDAVYPYQLSWEEFKRKGDDFEPRFESEDKIVRLGGGGINFAIVAASLGAPGVHFAGFMDADARKLARLIMKENGIDFPLIVNESDERRNTVIELADRNIILTNGKGSRFDGAELASLVDSIGIRRDDWIASMSFYDLAFPLLGKTGRFFLDSGYGYHRKKKLLISALIERLKGTDFRDFIIAANDCELANISAELGKSGGDMMEKGDFVSRRMSGVTGVRVNILLHTASYSTVFEPEGRDFWVVPTMNVSVVRRTNAGDSFAGAFLPAFDATGDFRLSCFFANAAAAKRLASDELPTRENTRELLRKVRMRKLADLRGKEMGAEALRERLALPRASSVYMRASPGGAFPHLQSAK